MSSILPLVGLCHILWHRCIVLYIRRGRRGRSRIPCLSVAPTHTDCIGSHKFNYHTIWTTTAPWCTVCYKLVYDNLHTWVLKLDTALRDNVCQWLATGMWFLPGTVVSTTNKNLRPRYSWNTVESGVKHNNPKEYDKVLLKGGWMTAITGTLYWCKLWSQFILIAQY
jgi:hypothetical protein